MNKNARKWVAALKSGEYKQVKHVLCELDDEHNLVGHCCLGVACELYQEEVGGLDIKIDKEMIDGRFVTFADFNPGEFTQGVTVLPECVGEWLGLNDISGGFRDEHKASHSLASLNDNGKSFDQIADAIESEPNGLFVSTIEGD